MIVIDTSAIIAIIFVEPEESRFIDAVASAGVVNVSAVSVLEALMVAGGRLGEDGVSKVNRVLLEMELIVRPFDERQARLAHEAFRKFGKGVHSKARLNMGDCASYALAKSLNAPLLFKGDDFPHTDIVAAV